MKILFIHTHYYASHVAGGSENSLRVLAEAMHGKGYDVSILATSDKEGLHKEIVDGITVYRAGIKNNCYRNSVVEKDDNFSPSKIKKIIWHIRDIYNTGMQVYVREVIGQERPDIISCHVIAGWSISVWDTIKKANIPMVQVLHDYYCLCIRSSLFKQGRPCKGRCIECRIMRLLHRRKSQQVDAVVGVCANMLNRVTEAGFFSNSVKAVIHDAQVIPDTGENKIKRNQNRFVFGFIGRLSPSKGVRWLIEQFKKIESKDVQLRIAGKGDIMYENALKTLASDDNRISFLGFSKPEEFYSSIDVLVVPSMWEEPLGLVAVEACAYHVPVITSATGGLKEVIKDGVNGLHCNISDPDSLHTAMNKIIMGGGILLDKLRKNARESVKSFLDTDQLVSEYENVYRQILDDWKTLMSR
jgi:glycosyltransferase involved in cell wall biosynthesis